MVEGSLTIWRKRSDRGISDTETTDERAKIGLHFNAQGFLLQKKGGKKKKEGKGPMTPKKGQKRRPEKSPRNCVGGGKGLFLFLGFEEGNLRGKVMQGNFGGNFPFPLKKVTLYKKISCTMSREGLLKSRKKV